MVDTEEIQVSFPYDNSGEDPTKTASDVQDEISREDTQNSCMKRLGWHVILIVILVVLFISVTGVLVIQINKHPSAPAESQHTAKEILAAWNISALLKIENSHLKQLLNSTYQNFTSLRSEYGQLKLLMNATLYNFTLLSAKKTQMSMLLKSTLQDKIQLQVENEELNMLLNSTLENCNLVKEENRQLNQLLNESLKIITLASEENKRLRQLLINERETNTQLKTVNQHQRSILFSDHLSFLWGFCNKSTLQCSRCPPGWVEHASRCFFLSQEIQKWEIARRDCLDRGGDLAVVLNANDQAFLTNLTFQFVQAHPQVNFHSAWIGLQDMVKEGTHFWINGKPLKSGVIYWKSLEPNNALASWDKHNSGQDCVAIVPPRRIGQKDWLNSWDDIVCGGKRHYLCETIALNVT